jgi:hypothetical protein
MMPQSFDSVINAGHFVFHAREVQRQCDCRILNEEAVI